MIGWNKHFKSYLSTHIWGQGLLQQRGVTSLYSPTAGTRWAEGKLMSHRKIGIQTLATEVQEPSGIPHGFIPLQAKPIPCGLCPDSMGSSLGLPSASPEVQPFPLCYVHLIGVILGWGGLPSPSCTSFLASLSCWRHWAPLTMFKMSSLWSGTALIAPGHFSPNACPTRWPALLPEHLHNMLEQCWSYWCNFPTKCSLV